MADNDSKWLRKATDLERRYEIGHKLKVSLTHYTLELASVKPISEDFLRRALDHLYKKVPVLRVCLQEKNSELWLRKMDQCEIDLKVIEGGDLEVEKDKVTVHTYNSETGPLWCVRFLPLAREKISPLTLPQEKNFSHNYALIFGIHHSISDGTTNVKICNLLSNILNDLMAGRDVDDQQQLGEHTGDEELQKLYDRETKRLKADPELCKEIKTELEEGSKVRPLIRHICKVPSATVITTKTVEVAFDQSISERLYKKAKSEGVTLHSAVAGLINLALTKLMQEYGIDREEYNIRAGHDINIRRYYSGDASRVLGVHGNIFGGYMGSFIVPKDFPSCFWETVKAFQEKFHSDIADCRVLTTSAYRMMTEDTNNNFQEMYRSDGEPNYYYTISNMGNLKGMLTEEGECVAIRKLFRFSSLRSGACFMSIFIHTFREQLNISFAYSTRFLTHEFVTRLKDLFHIHIKSVCEI